MLRRFSFCGASFLAIAEVVGAASAQTALPTIDVGSVAQAARRGADSAAPGSIIGAPSTPSTDYTVDRQGMNMTSLGGVNPIRAIANLPGVDAPAIDPYGMANLPGGNKGVRIRGELVGGGNSLGTVEGLPLSGINPGPGVNWLVDNENLSKIMLRQGPVSSDVNSYFTVGGVIESRLRWPEKKMGGEISQSVGSFGFLRTFARVDSGEILDGTTKLFVSGTWSDAEKWRGEGKSPQGKSGFAIGVETKPVENFEAKVFAAKTSFDEHNYRGLSYQQASDLGRYRSFDFNTTPGLLKSDQVAWYGYNLQHFDLWTTFAEFTLRLNEDTRFVVKPYYFYENGYYLDGTQNGKIRRWVIDHDFWGVTSELQTRFVETDVKLGHWFGQHNLPGPPTAWQTYDPTASGGLINSGWSILAQQTHPNTYNSVYGLASRSFGPLFVEAGARYVWQTLAGIDEHAVTPGMGDVSYDTALALSPGVLTNRSVQPFTVGNFLPYGALSYQLTDDILLHASASVGYGRLSYDLWPAYQQNAATFLSKGLTADAMWRQLRPETAEMVDFGLRWSFAGAYGSGYIEPIGFYSRNHHKLVPYDPGIGVSYGQNVGESEGLGAQLMAHFPPQEAIDLFASVGYQTLVFVEDLPALPGASAATLASLKVAGKQVPDVPYWIASVGANWRIGQFTLTPIVHVVGDRMGDTTGRQPIPGYGLLDLAVKYEHALEWGQTLEAGITVANLFDQRYIGQISNDYFQQFSSSGIYFPGAPRTVVGKVGIRF
ncbi:TonB-dependent receptor [Methylosinus sp. Sm6]|nr:TonB-dependent receptor [Methylosinus sp. Sm6]